MKQTTPPGTIRSSARTRWGPRHPRRDEIGLKKSEQPKLYMFSDGACTEDGDIEDPVQGRGQASPAHFTKYLLGRGNI